MASAVIETNNSGVIMRERNWCTATYFDETLTFRLHASAIDVMHNLHDCTKGMEIHNINNDNDHIDINKSSTLSPTNLLDYLTACIRYVKSFNVQCEEAKCKQGEDVNTTKKAETEERNNAIRCENKYQVKESDTLLRVAHAVYMPLEVEVSMLDDPTAIPPEEHIMKTETECDWQEVYNVDVMVDKWTPLHLALVTRHNAFVKEMIEFHTYYGVMLLQQVCAWNNNNSEENNNDNNTKEWSNGSVNMMGSKNRFVVKCCMSTLFAGTPVLLKSESEVAICKQHNTEEEQRNHEQMDEMATECCGSNADTNTCEIKDCLDITVEMITTAMKPIIEMLMKYYKQQKYHQQIDKEDENEKNGVISFVREIETFMQVFFAEHSCHNVLTCIIDSNVLCDGVIQYNWLHSLSRLLALFHGALSPVLYGTAISPNIWHHISLLPHRPSSALRRRASNLSFYSSSNSRSRNSSMDRTTRSFTPVRNTSFPVTSLASASNNNCRDAKEEEEKEKKKKEKDKEQAHSKSLERKFAIGSHPNSHEASTEHLEENHKADNPLLVPLELHHNAEIAANTSSTERNKVNVTNASICSNCNNKRVMEECTDVEAFWWDCGPQEIHKLLVTAMTIECRARLVEPTGPTYLHRFGRLLHDVHRLLAIHVKLMSLVATDHLADKTQYCSNNNENNSSSMHMHDQNRTNHASHLANIHEHKSHHHDHITTSQHQHQQEEEKNLKTHEVIPHNAIWSAHLLLLSLWLSTECTVEKMVDLIGEENVSLVISSPGNVPVAFTLILALSEYVTSFITQLSLSVSRSLSSSVLVTEHGGGIRKKCSFAEELQHIRCKVNVLLSEGHQRGPSLKQFITTGLLNQSDRFRELWLQEIDSCINHSSGSCSNNTNINNNQTHVKKFKTRVEMLHYGVVERLLKELERMSCTNHNSSSVEEDKTNECNKEMKNNNNKEQIHTKHNAEGKNWTHEGEAVVFDYLKMWHKYFVSLEEYATKRNMCSNDISHSNKHNNRRNEEKHEYKELEETKEKSEQGQTELAQQQEQQHSHMVEENARSATSNSTAESISVNEKENHKSGSTNSKMNVTINAVLTKEEMKENDMNENNSDNTLEDLMDESEEQVAHREVCESLHVINSRFLPRLKYGKSILPTLAVYFETHNATHDRILSNVSFTATNTNTNTSKVECVKSCNVEEQEKMQQEHKKESNSIRDKAEKELDERFAYAQTEFAQLAARCSNDVKLKFYGLYKQAMDGDVSKSAPWRFDLVGRAKWEAWSALCGMSKEEAKREYVKAYDKLQTSNIVKEEQKMM